MDRMASMEDRVTMDHVIMNAAGVIAAAGEAGVGKIAKEGNRPPFYSREGCSQFPKVAQDVPCPLK